jgi:hypothetical protein
MRHPPSGSTLPQRRRWNPHMTGMPQEIPQPPTAFVRSYVRPSRQSRRVRRRGHVTGLVLGGTSSPAIPTVSSTSFVARTSKSWRWPMAGDGPDTGGHGSETRSNRSRHGAVHNLVRRAKPFPRLLPSSGAEKFESPSLTDRTRLSGPAIFSGGGNEESTPCQAGPQGSLRG